MKKIDCFEGPIPIVHDPTSRSALLEFITGSPISQDEITESDVVAATDFFLQMNRGREHALDLPSVSEARFSIDGHLAIAAHRLARVAQIQLSSEFHAKAQKFVKSCLQPLWISVEAFVRGNAEIHLEDELPERKRCLSPSDFGFHNALRETSGKVRFVDFEYAGWDDPAKTIIDFCNQPDRLLPVCLSQIFRETVVQSFPFSEQLERRVRLLEPVYQLKWSCICLNGFLRDRPGLSLETQLSRARTMAMRASESLDALSRNN